jgi:hypothetical protein
MPRDVLYLEMFDGDNPAPLPEEIAPPISPLLEFEAASGVGDQLCRELLQDDFIRGVIGSLPAMPAPTDPRVKPYSYQQSPLPAVETEDEDGEGLETCFCKCQSCIAKDCRNCSGNPKCEMSVTLGPVVIHAAYIGGLLAATKARLGAFAKAIDPALWKGLQKAMCAYIAREVA